MKKVLVHHWRMGITRNNLGEALVPYIIQHFGFDYTPDLPIHANKSSFKLMMIGSELSQGYIKPLLVSGHKIFVWGCGYSEGIVPYPDHKIDIRGVRGFKTLELLGVDVPVGDPAFLMPEIMPVEKTFSKKEYWAPHWHNRSNKGWEGTEFFNVEVRLSKLRDEIEKLCAASFVYTSSLHVAIICMAYKVPFACCLTHGDIINKPFKWYDLWSTLNVPHRWCITKESAHDWYDRYGSQIETPSMEAMKSAFPHDVPQIKRFLM